MKNIPERIYLQIGEDCEADDFSDLSEVTWAEDCVNENDILYVKPLSSDAVLAEVRAELERHKKSTELLREIEAYLSFRIIPDIDNMIKMKAGIVKHLSEHFS